MANTPFDTYVHSTEYWLGDAADLALGHLPVMGTFIGWIAALMLVAMWGLSTRRSAPVLRARRGGALIHWQDLRLLWACRGALASWAAYGAALVAMSGGA